MRHSESFQELSARRYKVWLTTSGGVNNGLRAVPAVRVALSLLRDQCAIQANHIENVCNTDHANLEYGSLRRANMESLPTLETMRIPGNNISF